MTTTITTAPATVDVQTVRFGSEPMRRALWDQLPRLTYGYVDEYDLYYYPGDDPRDPDDPYWFGNSEASLPGFPWQTTEARFDFQPCGIVNVCSACVDNPFDREGDRDQRTWWREWERDWSGHVHILGTLTRLHRPDDPHLCVLAVRKPDYLDPHGPFPELPHLFIGV